MADFPDNTLLSKVHNALSRRSLMRFLGAAGLVSVAPGIAISAPRRSALVRLHELIDELMVVAKEVDPSIKEWVIDTKDIRLGTGVPLVIAAFANPPNTDPLLHFGWTYRHGANVKNKDLPVAAVYRPREKSGQIDRKAA